MENDRIYNRDEVINCLNQAIEMVEHLDNDIFDRAKDVSKGDNDMSKRIGQKVTVNGKEHWIHGYSVQELFDNYVNLMVREGLIEWVDQDVDIPCFGDYVRTYYDTFKQEQESNTVINRERVLKNHILPQFGDKRIDRIKTMDIQKYFTELGRKYSRETILKIKNIMRPVFEAAVEDCLITRNPMSSSRLEIGGRETVHHRAISKEKMDEIKQTAESLPENEKILAGLLCYTGLRFEEILGLRWDDISDGWITIKRAVVHPTRNMPEVKSPKTKTSERRIPVAPELQKLLNNGLEKVGYLLASSKDRTCETPLSYTEARRLFDKIRYRFDIRDHTAHDFRDTCATEWREKGMPLDVIARILGHSKTETTEKRYVKYRTDILNKAKELM